MESLDLKQMENLIGGGHCDAAENLKWAKLVSPAALVLWLYETAACEASGNGDTF
ncbi:hypothetical protein [Tenacibaculum singaporense]|uniref:hypothetical protein n=1 Tax=Tenacibaculum singaporense TaxID=2358479 RepID=UPI0013DD8774|nr:hypothetical protein [Tenacibaculum singaporense]